MFFTDDFKLTDFIEQAIVVLLESQDPEKMGQDPVEIDENFEDEHLDDLGDEHLDDLEELYMDDSVVSRDRAEKRLRANWHLEKDQPRSDEEWQALASAVVSVLRLQEYYWRRHSPETAMFIKNGKLIIHRAATLRDLLRYIPADCSRCGAVKLRRSDLIGRYGFDYRVAEIYNDGPHNEHCPRCAGPIRLLIQWFDPDDRSCEIPEDEE
jgi:hypothetical protein